MLAVVETSLFLRYAGQVWDEDEREAFIQWIAAVPDAGDVIPGSQGLRKVRWSRSGMGKQGGSRVIYYLRCPQGEIVLYWSTPKQSSTICRPTISSDSRRHVMDPEIKQFQEDLLESIRQAKRGEYARPHMP